MDSPHTNSTSPTTPNLGPVKSSNSSTRVVDDVDVTSLTSFNPFSEEDEHESGYTLVSSLFSRVRNSFAAPLSTAAAAASGPTTTNGNANPPANDTRRVSGGNHHPVQTMSPVLRPASDKLRPKIASASGPTLAAPVVSTTPALSDVPSIGVEYEKPPASARSGMFSTGESMESGWFGSAIPGFPIQEDARSIHTAVSLKRSASVSKVIRRIRGEGLSKDYWMDDETCKECYDCKSVFTTWRRKHHCRICGQIFCSRCASNVIKGSKFGQEGMLRVCNLCLEKLQYDDDDDDDRRSVISSISSAVPHHVMDSYLSSLGHHSQSPFAASQLFSRSDEPFNLYSIAETRRHPSGSDGSGFNSRPLTPGVEIDLPPWEENVDAQPAPFRRAMTDEDKDSLAEPDPFPPDQSPTGSRTAPRSPLVESPLTLPFPTSGAKSSIQFPGGSPEHGPDSPGAATRSRVNSQVDSDIQTPFLRSRVQSRLNELAYGDAGWRTRRESTAYAQELNTISMFHLRIMLRQMLTTEGISNIKEWEETLLKLSLRIARDLTFTAFPNREGTDMDVRRYVKIKKIPGGTPKDSEYVDGAVITKNVAHKQMSKSQRNPRVMLVTFPLEFQRVEGQYMHFAQILRQEKEYLNNLASRIAALRPHIVLVEKSVSRFALEALVKHNIAVARTVKESAIKFVARMTQGDIFSSIDKLAIEPHLGHCGRFRIQTFDHPLIPSRRKSYLRFEGCGRELGCTIILRGGGMDHLKRVKKVTLFLAFIVRNLKLETHLWKDSVITAPHLSTDAAPQAYLTPALTSASVIRPSHLREITPSDSVSAREGSESQMSEADSEALDLSRRVQSSLEPYLKTFISVSATLRFPPPYPVRRMKELDDELQRVRRAWEDELIRQEEKPTTPRHNQEATVTQQDVLSVNEFTMSGDLRAQIDALPSPGLLETPTPQGRYTNAPDTPMDTVQPDYFSRKPKASSSYSSLRSPLLPPIAATPFDDSCEEVKWKDESEIATQSALDLVQWQHDEHRRVWEWYLRKNKDDFTVDKYQCISVMRFTLPITELGHHRACFPPELSYMTFYGKNDCTLGQFIEKSVHDNLVQFLDPKAICSGKACDQPLARHCQVFVHNESRLLVYVEHWDGQIKTRLNAVPSPDLITTWSACRVCGSATPFIPVSEEMQRYSFAKFLELHFYPADVQLVQGAGCIHNIYQHHIRYFAMRGMTVMFQTDPIILYEIIFPPSRIRIRRETLFQLKNKDYAKLLARNAQWYASLIDDLKLVQFDSASGEKEQDDALGEQISMLTERALEERRGMAKLIQEVYHDSGAIDTLALNRVRAERQDKIVAWEAEFDKLPKPKISQLTEKDRKSTFNTVRSMWPKRYDFPGVLENLNLPQLVMSEGEDTQPRPIRRSAEMATPTDLTSDASDAETATKGTVALPSSQGSEIQDDPTPRPRIKSGSDSDSTIPAAQALSAAGKDDTLGKVSSPTNVSDTDAEAPPRASRLPRPRRPGQQPSVADLVKRYQDFLPPTVATQIASNTPQQSPFIVAESDQEAAPVRHTTRPRLKSRPKLPHRKESTSDFEYSYAASIAPKYLAHRRTSGVPPSSNRFSQAGPSSMDSRDSSRRTSPDKRQAQRRTGELGRASSPPPSKPSIAAPNRGGKVRIASRSTPKEKGQTSRIPSMGNVRSNLRKSSHTGIGSKVSNIARQFERIHKDTERVTRRYAVIRGRRARPVASSKGATVEVFDSVKDALKDVSDESGESSSEADDEEEDEEEGPLTVKRLDRVDSSATAKPLPVLDQKEPPVSSGTTVTDPESHTASALSQESSGEITQSENIPQETPPASGDARSGQSGQSGETSLETPSPSDAEAGGAAADRPSIILKALSGFLPHHLRGTMDIEGDDPMADPEHIFRESSMVVRTDEPTSIIALALNSPQYREMLIKSKAEKRNVKEPKLSEDREAFMPDDCSVAETNSTWGVVNVNSTTESNPTDDLRVPSSKLPWAISFESGGLTITCTILYPEQFDALRRTTDCEKSMIESLARCVKWNASGGKSGSAFLKTQDDRFIAKELSRAELETMAAFGPAYFDYMSSAVSADRPTLLARVFGIYKLTFRKKTEGKSKSKSTQMNLLVMENLFYDKRFTKIFDLKGSTRNRHVQSTGRENEVLLDENLVETAHLNPFYVREHAKRLFRGACFNDTKFLSDINVMDYSLVVGVDSAKNELVVGIVDYIRTYTWDKKLESWVKESTFLAAAGKGEPTIVSPKQYRQRFLSAMERYFPLVPDRWMKQNDSPEDEGNALLELWPDW